MIQIETVERNAPPNLSHLPTVRGETSRGLSDGSFGDRVGDRRGMIRLWRRFPNRDCRGGTIIRRIKWPVRGSWGRVPERKARPACVDMAAGAERQGAGS